MFVKICGITNLDDALLAVAMDADALGFVFAPSRRQVQIETARDIVKRLPSEAVTVGVFRDERPERVVEICNRVGLQGAQLHGREPLGDVRYVRERVQFVIQAYKAGDPGLELAANSPADIVLVDGPNPGSGKVFDWALADQVPPGVRLLLAGGLHHQNVADAIERIRPWGVDVSSGVERSPGHKDPTKVRLFVQAAKAAGERLADRGVLAGRRSFTLPSDHGEPLRLDAIADLPMVEAGVTRPWDWSLDGI